MIDWSFYREHHAILTHRNYRSLGKNERKSRKTRSFRVLRVEREITVHTSS